ncbi:MAG: cytochrome c biogenesis protein CcsA [Ilumatobacteraceae bacterium]
MAHGATTAAWLLVSLTVASPFERLDVPAIAGAGLTPILEHPAMAIHPPLLYLGLSMLSVPAMAVLVTGGQPTPAESARLRRWTLAALAVLTVALVLGAWWSYSEQGWGGYWAWDPVENASLVAWLATVAALHAGGGTASRRVVAGGALVCGPARRRAAARGRCPRCTASPRPGGWASVSP